MRFYHQNRIQGHYYMFRKQTINITVQKIKCIINLIIIKIKFANNQNFQSWGTNQNLGNKTSSSSNTDTNTNTRPNNNDSQSTKSLQQSPIPHKSINIESQQSKKASKTQSKSNQINEQKIGVPHIQNPYWLMLRNGKTKSLSKAFQDQLVTCDSVIVPTSGHTVLHESVILDRREYFKLCEVYGADWDKGDLNGVTALMKAVALNRTYYVEKLIQLGADKDPKDNRGMRAQDYGYLYESYEALDLLKQQ